MNRDSGNQLFKINAGDIVSLQKEGANEKLFLVVGAEKAILGVEIEKTRTESSFGISIQDLAEGNIEGELNFDKLFTLEASELRKVGKVKPIFLEEALRDLIKHLSRVYYNNFHKQDEKTKIPASGKILDQDDLCNLIDASLDMWLTAGRFAEEFEKEFPKFFGRKYCALVNSGSSANLLAITALTSYKLGDKRLKPGNEVITVAAGFPTTIAPIIQNGLVPVFVDIDIGTYNVNVEQLEKAVSEKTKAIFLAHTLGNPFDVDKVMEIANKHNLWLIEDNCDALGSKYKGKLTGTFGDISTVSFYPAHHMTMGEGGAILVDNPELYKIIQSLRDWGRDCWCPPGKDNTCGKRFDWKLGDLPYGYDHKYIYSHLGFNLKATDFQAALGLSQLKKLPDFIEKRKENFNRLYAGFKKEGLDKFFILPQWLEEAEVSWFGFVLTIKDDAPFKRKELLEFLEENGIGTRLLFAGDMLRQPAFTFSDFKFRVAGNLKNTDKIMVDTFWIGVWPGINEEGVNYISSKFLEFTKIKGQSSIAELELRKPSKNRPRG